MSEFKTFFDEINRLDIEEAFHLHHFPHLDYKSAETNAETINNSNGSSMDYQLSANLNLSVSELPELLKLLCEVSYEYMQALKEAERRFDSITDINSTLPTRISIAEGLDRHLFYLIGIVHPTQRGFIMDMRAGLLADFGTFVLQKI